MKRPGIRRRHAAQLLLATSLLPVLARAQNARPEAPQYGGKLEIGTIYVTLSALSWDPADWNWKINHDGGMYEQLFAADLSKSKRHGGKHTFYADAWIPPDAIKGELAESWRWADPLKLEIKLRRGVMFPDKPGVMKARELVADDVVFAFNRLWASPKKTVAYFDHVKKVSALDKSTVVFEFNDYNAEWDYRFGYGYYSGIVPKEVADAGAANWKNANGSGPFMLSDHVPGNSNVYVKNPNYWDKETINGTEYKLPFVDQIAYRTIKDEATFITALRTARLDVLEFIRWQHVAELKKNAPQLQWERSLSMAGTYLAMRVDVKPFDDVRVRRAMNLAVNKEEIIKAYYGGNAEMFAYPQHPDYGAYYEPLASMPDSVKELFTYNPQKAKRLLAEAGYPNGFTFKAQFSPVAVDHIDLMPLLVAYLEQVGVKMEVQAMEYPAFLSAMTTRTNAPGYLMNNGHTNPLTTLRKNFVPGQVWNPSQWNDPAFTKKVEQMYEERDEPKRQALAREMVREIVDKAPYLWLPTQYFYRAWWPWVKNYGGEVRAGAVRPWPIYARIWVDQELKRRMGFA